MFYRVGEVIELVRLSKRSIYRMARAGQFPAPVKLGARASGWRKEEIDQWAASRKPA